VVADKLIGRDLPQPKRELLAPAIADAIAEAVATRHLDPGERVVETTLAKSYNTSRVPVREALKILHTQGILTGGGHRGYRVAEFSRAQIAQVTELRLMLEAILWRDALAVWQTEGPDFHEMDAELVRMEIAARGGDFRGILNCDLGFHRAICRASRNQIAFNCWEGIARHTLIIFNIARYRDQDLAVVVTRHRSLLDWLRARIDGPPVEDTEVRDLLAEHIQINRSPIRDAQERIAGQ
jgi:DNA-binding GntR family transcriptional regulator